MLYAYNCHNNLFYSLQHNEMELSTSQHNIFKLSNLLEVRYNTFSYYEKRVRAWKVVIPYKADFFSSEKLVHSLKME